MAQWATLAEMAVDLSLAVDRSDRRLVRAEIRRQMADLHPDRHGGTFASQADEERYRVLGDALSFCDDAPSAALLRLDDVAALVTTMRGALEPRRTPQDLRDEYLRSSRIARRERLSAPRITSGVFGGICAGLLVFSGQLADNPVFSRLLRTSETAPLLLMGFLLSGTAFVMTWIMEQRAAAYAEWLATTEGRNTILWHALDSASDTFRRFDLVAAIRSRRLRRMPRLRHDATAAMIVDLLLSDPSVPLADAERLADLHLAQLEEGGVATRKRVGGLEAVYAVRPEAASEIRRFRARGTEDGRARLEEVP